MWLLTSAKQRGPLTNTLTPSQVADHLCCGLTAPQETSILVVPIGKQSQLYAVMLLPREMGMEPISA